MFKRDGIIYTKEYEGEHRLSPERLEELKAHFHQCELHFFENPDDPCFELFKDIGYAEYEQLALLYPEDMAHL